MKVQDALKPTGMAVDKDNKLDGTTGYIQWNVAAKLYWHDKETGKERRIVEQKEMFSETYEPYHEEKEISPEKYQIWETLIKGKCLIFEESDNELWYIFGDGSRAPVYKDMVHGKHGWMRFDPPVKEDNKDRQIIELQKAVIKSEEKPFVIDELARKAADTMLELKFNDRAVEKNEISTGKLFVSGKTKKIVIEGVMWDTDEGRIYPVGGFKEWESLINKPLMKMTLEYQEEQHEPQG